MKTLLPIIAVLFALHLAAADHPEWSAKSLVKPKMCALCHSKAKLGDQQSVWEKGSHANAFASLGTEKAKAIAAKQGISDPQKSGKCLSCHSTAYGFGEKRVSTQVKPEDGVTCQSCHGPGKGYLAKHAKNRQLAIDKYGLVKPKAAECLRCHNSQSPTHDPTKSFDFAAYWARITHSLAAGK
ncbi:MAG: hypothetical protein ACI8W8_004768 [Rhodothermales bacterium]|jgi:hypothetical protein